MEQRSQRTPARIRIAYLAAGCAAVLAVVGFVSVTQARDVQPSFDVTLGLTPDPDRGLELLLTEPMGAPVMKTSDVDRLWKVWEPELRAKAEQASAEERRRMTFERYGWAERPGNSEYPLGYTPDSNGNLVTNCFACHGGKIAGRTIPGMGNTHVDLTTLATDVRKLALLDAGGDPSTVKDAKAPFNTPLNYHRGVTNAVVFASVFAGLRDPELGKQYIQNPDLLPHHDMNAPPWWHYSKKERIYCDAFAPKTPRQLMPFAMSPLFSDEKFRSFESNFVHIEAFVKSVEPPKYPFEIDRALAEEGRELFNKNCKKCHGSYGEEPTFPSKLVPLEEIQTDPIRLTAVSRERRETSNAGWLQYNGEHLLDLESEGYLAQPLDGIWASAPYLHNGSVPTLYHLFNVDERPDVWKRDEYGYDKERVGLNVEEFESVPDGLNTREQRMYYNTAHPGNSAAGHTFPDDYLSAEEKWAVLEYLKTL